uniref:TPR_REGION domain-containing protein n=1 Tax=Macrostomum lignano TaxID=282301 RepID=A0A1I8HDH6_9PLAT
LLLLLIQPVWPPHPLPASASTHWVASPDGGLPQPLPAEQSRLSMRRPADLAEWLRQWERLQLLDSLERELAESDATLESMPAKDDAFVEQFQRSNADCVAAGKPLQDLDLFVSVPLDPGLDLGAKPDTAWRAVSLLVPDCEAAMELPFSMDSLEHVASVRHRAELEAPPDIFLYRTAVPGGLTPDQYGHLIGEAMAANASSWHLHNMASYYWRIKGDAPRAAECALRALRLASHHSRDAVLLNLASLLHAAKRHSDALTVLRSALAINSRSQAAYMLLGNVLTLLADFPAALRAYQSALALPLSSPPAAEKQQQQQPATGDKKSGKAEKPSLPEATPSDSSLTSKAAPSAGAVLALRADAQRKAAAVRCQLGLESSLRQQNRQVGAAMARVQRFHARSEALARAKELAASEVAPLQARKASEAAYQEYLARHPSLSPAAQPTAAAASSSASSPSLQPSAADFSQPRRPPVHQAPRIDLPEALRYLVNASAFPSPSECRSHGETSGSDLQSVPSEHVPLENKGFESVAMLTDGLGIRIGDEHPLPWYPPDCSEFPDPQPSRLTGDHLEAVKLARAADPSVGQQSSASSSRHQQRQPMDGFASMQPEPAEPLLGGLSLRMHLDDLGQRLLTGLRSGRGGPHLSNYSGAEAHYLAAMRQDPERAADLTARLAAVRCQRRSAEAAGIGGHSASSPFDPDRPCRGRHACAELRAHFQEKICDLYSHYMQYSASECLAPANSIAFKVPHIHLLPRKDNSQAVIKGLLFNSDRSGAAADPSGADCVVFNDSSQSPGCQKLAAATAAAKVLAETVEFVNRLQRLIDRHAELLQAGRPPLSQLNLE